MAAELALPILLGLGANLPSPVGPPRATLEQALVLLAEEGVRVLRRSRWYRTAPVPVSDQPWFVNGAALLETDLPPAELLARLHRVEAKLGRVRAEKNAARTVDLDILAYRGEISDGVPLLPHPRLAERAFVLLPLAEIYPGWVHPATGEAVAAMIARLPPGQQTLPLEEGWLPA